MAYKDFQAAQVLTAQEVDTYLMNQSVIVFDDATARSTTLTAPTEGMITYLKDIDQVQFYNGTTWVALVSANSRNLLYNGEMLVSQRGTVLASTTRYTCADRWKAELLSAGQFRYQIVDDVPDNSGFRRATEIACIASQNPLSSGAYNQFSQWLEGFDVQQINKGTASAQPVTLQFWVKTNKTGTYNVELRDETNSRFAVQRFTVSVADTWQKVVLIYPPDTTGQLAFSNATALKLQIWLGAGSNFRSGTYVSTWQTGVNNTRAVDNVNLGDNSINYLRITGTQLNVGYLALFEYKSYAQYLQECERYYQVHTQPAMRGVTANAFGRMGYALTTTMRANASLASNGGTMGFYNGGAAAIANVNFTAVYNLSPSSVEADISSSGWGTGNAAIFYKDGINTFAITCDAEL